MSRKSDMYDKYGDIIPDGYNSPIELIAGNLQTQIENDAVKVVQSYGFNVDKAELEKALKYDRDQYEKGYADARMKYERPQGEWIPVSERLPDYMDDILITFQKPNREPLVYRAIFVDGKFNLDNGDTWNWNDPEITAWMPLPEPYKDIDGDTE